MKLGVSGTRDGWTFEQGKAFVAYLDSIDWEFSEFHFGDCKGVDEQAAHIVWNDHDGPCKIISHPPIIQGKFFANFPHSDERRHAKDYLDRNRYIVHECDTIIIIPKETEPQQRGGTWFTFREALEWKKTVYVIWPDGTMKKAQRELPNLPDGWELVEIRCGKTTWKKGDDQ